MILNRPQRTARPNLSYFREVDDLSLFTIATGWTAKCWLTFMRSSIWSLYNQKIHGWSVRLHDRRTHGMLSVSGSDVVDKRTVDDLAVFGGRPAFDSRVHVGRPHVGDQKKIIDSFGQVLERRWLSNSGPNVRRLEERLATQLGVNHVVCMCNGTVALEIAIRAAGLCGEVIVPSFTFVATAHALQWQQITPIFCDVDPATHNIDPVQVERLITPNTTGILGVHLWGRPCDTEALEAIARKHSLCLMFDAAHAFNCTHMGKRIGGFGRAEVFSFHATKVFNTLEGGAVATNDGAMARKMRLMKNFGFTGYDQVDHIGTNGKMNEISAAMGLANLDALDDFIEINRRNIALYRRELDVPGVRLIQFSENEHHNYQYVVVEIDVDETGLERDEIVALLHAENVLARRYFYPGCHRMEPYRSNFPNAGLLLPETDALIERVLCLPTGSGADEQDIRTICGLIQFMIQRREEIRERGAQLTAGQLPKFGRMGVAT